MASKLAEAFGQPEYQSSGPEWLRMIGAVANRVRGGGLAPDPTTVAGFLPGAGFVQGNQDAGKARAAFGRGEYGQAAVDMGNSMLNTASELAPIAKAAKMAMAIIPAYHGSPKRGLSRLLPGERGALGPGVYSTPDEGLAKRYAGPDGQVYRNDVDDAELFQGMKSNDSSINPFQVWRDQTARLVDAAEPEMKQAVSDIAGKMDPNDGYPFFARLAQLYKSDAGAQDLMKRAGFKGMSGYADGPEIVQFGAVDLPAPKPPGIRAFHGSPLDASNMGAQNRVMPEFDLYHGTNKDGYDSIMRDREIRGPAFLTPKKAAAEEYSSNYDYSPDAEPHVVSVRVPSEKLMIDLDMGASRLHPVDDANRLTGNDGWTIEDYINAGHSIGVPDGWKW